MFEIWPDQFVPSAATIDGVRYLRLHLRDGEREAVVGYRLDHFVAFADQLQMLAHEELRRTAGE